MKERNLLDLDVTSNRDTTSVWADLCRFHFKKLNPLKAQFLMNRWTRDSFKFRTIVQNRIKNDALYETRDLTSNGLFLFMFNIENQISKHF